jgi:ADP-ribosylation factor GTPase-activating protein 1
MDKWKDSELAKMKTGGNQHAQDFFESQKDYQPTWNIYDKYNSRAAALLRDKVSFTVKITSFNSFNFR